MFDIKNIISDDIMDIITELNIDEINKSQKGTTDILMINSEGFTYKIGKGKSKKFVSKEELIWAIDSLKKNKCFTRKEYDKSFPIISKAKPCNFTSIGGMLSKIINEKYNTGMYYLD